MSQPVEHDAATVGPYHLVSVLGEGGFGVVYLAERRTPFVQAVALKVLKAGMELPSLVARFELERQALALMDHPNVARVLDGGVTGPESRLGPNKPYFVMELVTGKPITDYCRENRLGIRERLELFIPVCEAVQHAHAKGVVHRDLKPSNILVSRTDGGEAVPKVIDFGVAKVLAGSSLQQEAMTRAGNFIGTPEYMSPEQAAGGAASADIDTRTDVYSLGAVLYELLTGALPFDRDDLWKQDVLGMMRMIREVEPPRPSTRAAGLARTLSGGVPGWPDVGTGSLTRRLRGDLDWIVMKAMEKLRERRYQNPGALAADIGRYLRTEPVEAGPPSASYKVSKFVRRHRAGVAVAAAAAGGVIAVIASLAYSLETTRESEREQRKQLERAQRAMGLIESSVELARKAGDGDDVSFGYFLETMVKRVGATGKVQDPEDQALVRVWFGDIYNALRRPRQAEDQLNLAISLLKNEEIGRNATLARAQVQLARVHANQGEFKDAVAILGEVLPRIRGSKNPDVRKYLPLGLVARGFIEFRGKEYGPAERDLREAINLLADNQSDAQLLCEAKAALAQVLCEQPTRRDDALEAADEAVRMSQRWEEDNPAMYVTALNTLGRVKREKGDTDGAIESYSKALELAVASRGLSRPSIAGTQITLAQALRDVGRVDEAEKYAQAALKTRRDTEPGSLRVAEALDVTAGLAADREDLTGAEKQYREQLRIAREVANEPMAALAMTGLADVLARQEKYDDALRYSDEALKIRSRTLAAGHWKLHSTASIVGVAKAGRGDCEGAAAALTPAAEAIMADKSVPPVVAKKVVQRMVWMLERCGKAEEQRRWQQALDRLTKPEL